MDMHKQNEENEKKEMNLTKALATATVEEQASLAEAQADLISVMKIEAALLKAMAAGGVRIQYEVTRN